MEVWVLVFWLTFDRGGGPATADFTSKERCEAAAQAIFAAPAYSVNSSGRKNTGGYICVPK